jgi:hypothetical protein
MLRKTYKLTLSVLACTVVVACAVSKVEPLAVPLVYKTNPKNAGSLGSFPCAARAQLQVSDARNLTTIGVRIHESKPLKADVTAGSDPAAWVRDGVQGFLGQNGVTFAGGSSPTLVISIDTLHTTESIWHRASYEAQIAITGALWSPSRRPCWQGTGAGKAGNYGYAGSVEDYQDTLNSALDAAILQMTEPQTFKDALCRCGN